MSNYSPLGTDWLNWHAQRIFNFSEYLNLNGFFSSYGFSIWSSCDDCSLNSENWKDNIYLSLSFFSHLPHVIINKFFGEINLKLYGHYIDKTLIFFTGILLSELFLIFIKRKSFLYERIFISQLIFTFFVINPWTYKMILAHWTHIYFVFFFLFGVLMFIKNKIIFGFLSFFIAGCFEYQSSAGLFLFYLIIFITSKIYNKKNYLINFFYFNSKKKFLEQNLLLSLLAPVLIFFILKLLAADSFNNLNSGSSILERIGISGIDIHNGGLLGSLQFLGGNRITLCLIDFGGDLNSMALSKKIEVFNCSLSILSMFIISLISIYGLFVLYSYEK